MLDLKSMKINNNRLTGFTLIELLVVVAIIGILASVVIVNLNSARAKGQDSAIKQQMAQLRSSAELYYDNYSGYANNDVPISNCPNASSFANTFFSQPDVTKALEKIQADSGQTLKCAVSGKPTTGSLGSQSWVAFAALRSQSGKFWCVDSTGSSRLTNGTTPTTPSGTTDVTCPAS